MESPVHPLVMKERNLQLVRRTLRLVREATRQQLATATGLSTVTVGSLLQELMFRDEVREGSLVPSAGGRPSVLYRFHPGRAHVLAVFTRETRGVDTLYLRVADLFGQIIAAEESPLQRGVASLEEPVAQMLKRHPSVRAVGFGVPGTVENGVHTVSDYPEWAGLPIVDHFSRVFGLPVCAENDVNAAAAGYGRRNPSAPGMTLVYLYFPRKYPAGSGILIDGQVHRGRSGWGGEVAYLPLDIPWGDPSLFDDVGRGSLLVAKVVSTVSAVLNPHQVVLQGEFLTPDYLEAVDLGCRRLLPATLVPEIDLSADFTADYQDGLVALTLDLLEAKEFP